MEEGVKAVVYLGKASNVQNNQNVLVKGAIIYETDTNKLKISDGNTSVRKLKYLPFSQITATNITNWNKMYSDFYSEAGSFTETDPTVPNHVKAITTLEINNWNTAFGWGDHSTQGYLTSFSETDPTVPAAVKAITNTQITNWDTAFSWGNHALAGYLTSFSETDPTVPSAVKAITPTQISNWDTAFSWGNHASAGYLTSFTETDPTVPAAVKAITGTQISNWNTAFGWGNHASVGYLTSETDPTVASHIKAISALQISNWDTAFSWGDHSTAGYLTSDVDIDSFTFVVYNSDGSTILPTGVRFNTAIVAPVNGTITGWILVCDKGILGSAQVDVWKDSGAYPTSAAQSITNTDAPRLASQQINSNDATAWVTDFSVGDIFVLSILSNSNATYLKLIVTYTT